MSSNPIINKKEIVYLLVTKKEDMFKIGRTKDILSGRIESLNNQWEFDLEKSYIIITETNSGLEKTLHYLFRNHNIKGLLGDGSTEFFDINCFEEVLKTLETFKDSKFDNIEVKKISDTNLKIIRKNKIFKKRVIGNKVVRKNNNIMYGNFQIENETKDIQKLSIIEYKLFNVLLTKIDRYLKLEDIKDKDLNITITKEELENKYKFNTIKKLSIKRFLKNIIESKVVFFDKKDGKKTLVELKVFSKLQYVENTVYAKFNKESISYFMNLTERYHQYHFEYITKFNSIYSLMTYELLKRNEYKFQKNKVFKNIDYLEFPLKELFKIYNLKTKRTMDYGFIREKIFKVAQNEINEYSDIKFNYKPIKENKKIIAIQLLIESKVIQTPIEELSKEKLIREMKLLPEKELKDLFQNNYNSLKTIK